MAPETQLDGVVVGGGAACLYSALTAADAGSTVAIVSRKPLSESSSFWAQGGLAAAIGDDDSTQLHVQDTLAAGRHSCRRTAAELLARDAPGVVWELERRGVGRGDSRGVPETDGRQRAELDQEVRQRSAHDADPEADRPH